METAEERSKKEAEQLVLPKTELDFDSLLMSHVGEFGRYQKLLYLCLALTALGVIIQNLIQVFTGAIPPHLCLTDNSSSYLNVEINTTTQYADLNKLTVTSMYLGLDNLQYKHHQGDHPQVEQVTKTTKELDNIDSKCYLNSTFNEGSTVTYCQKWEYDRSQYNSTIVTEVNIILMFSLLMVLGNLGMYGYSFYKL